jgi:serine phosphatase RsbU (regulator of sigma subunit)
MAQNKRQILLIIVLLIFLLNLIESIRDFISNGEPGPVVGQLLLLALVGYIAYRSRDAIQRSREEYRRRFVENQDGASMRDAALFSLAWSREIYRSIPEDRKRIVRQAYALIGIGMVIVLAKVGMDALLTVLVIAALVLAGVNLLVWVFANERGEKERLRIELETARQMQLSLMPAHDPELPGFDISGVCVPALNVGGDHFDYVWFGPDRTRFGIAVVDVAGKGMDAALTAVFTSGAFVSEVQHGADISAVMNTLNAAIRSRNNRTRFVSFFLLSIDTEAMTANWVNAGQSKPVLLREGMITVLESDGPHFPLGLVDSVTYKVSSMELRKEDVLLLYTDGLTEAMNPAREMFGEERVRAVLRELGSAMPASELISAMRTRVHTFTEGADPHDDLTLVAARVL